MAGLIPEDSMFGNKASFNYCKSESADGSAGMDLVAAQLL